MVKTETKSTKKHQPAFKNKMRKALQKHGFVKTQDMQKGTVKAHIRDKETKRKNQYLKKKIQKRTDRKKKPQDDELSIEGDDLVINEELGTQDEFKLFANTENILDQFEKNLEEDKIKQYQEDILSDPKIKKVYEDLGVIMREYKSGKLPQSFHVLAQLSSFEDLLELSKPLEWSPQAFYAAIKIFVSSLDTNRLYYFLKNIFSEVIHQDMKITRKLKYHYYHALIKALYKPAVWIKGILFNLLAKPDFTIGQAQIIISIVAKHHVPVEHIAVAIYKLTSVQFSGPVATVLLALISKEYALPQTVCHKLVSYFSSFKTDERVLPVIWYQIVLKFMKLYFKSLKEEELKKIKSVVMKKNHHIMTGEILSQLNQLAKKEKQEGKMDLE